MVFPMIPDLRQQIVVKKKAVSSLENWGGPALKPKEEKHCFYCRNNAVLVVAVPRSTYPLLPSSGHLTLQLWTSCWWAAVFLFEMAAFWEAAIVWVAAAAACLAATWKRTGIHLEPWKGEEKGGMSTDPGEGRAHLLYSQNLSSLCSSLPC